MDLRVKRVTPASGTPGVEIRASTKTPRIAQRAKAAASWNQVDVTEDNQQAERVRRRRRRVRQLAASAYVLQNKGRRHLPPLIRAILGLCLVLMGILGFLPVLGFWMIPLGLALMATDIPPLHRWLKKRLQETRRNNR